MIKFNQLFIASSLVLSILILAACDKPSMDKVKLRLDLRTDKTMVAAGHKLFVANCATCHGSKGQGDPHWRKVDANGHWPPPPLNGSGHTWHHPQSYLIAFVQNGSPKGTMPAWKNKLTVIEIKSILAWAQSNWSDHSYNTWLETNKRNP